MYTGTCLSNDLCNHLLIHDTVSNNSFCWNVILYKKFCHLTPHFIIIPLVSSPLRGSDSFPIQFIEIRFIIEKFVIDNEYLSIIEQKFTAMLFNLFKISY